MVRSNSQTNNLPTNRNFGLFFAFVFLILFLVSKYRTVYIWVSIFFLTISFVLAIFATLKPQKLFHLNKLWFQFGQVLGRITNPIVLGVFFYFVITPVALVARLFGRDELDLTWPNKAQGSYWKIRKEKEINVESFKRQY